MVYKFALIVFLSCSFSGAKEITAVYPQLKGKTIDDKLTKLTEFFKDTPTGLDPLGEGSGIDPDPTYSLRVFDCTTYVETLIAIARSKNQKEIQEILNSIRYKNSEVDFFHRNHFMVTDWIPANSKQGIIKNITQEITDDSNAYQTDKRVLKKTIWFYHRAIDLLDKQQKPTSEILKVLAKIPILEAQKDEATYLKVDYFRKNRAVLQKNLPPVSIVMFIRNIQNIPTLVSHMGFAVLKDGEIWLSHGPQAKPWKVKLELLDDYFNSMDAHRAPVEGLLFLKILEPN